MTSHVSRSLVPAAAALLLCLAPAMAQTSFLGWQPGEEPGATPGVELVNISKNNPAQGSVFPQLAVSRSDPNFVAVAWRRYELPINTNTLDLDRVGQCHVAISRDGGKNFTDTNMMPYLRTQGHPPDPAKARTIHINDQGVEHDYTDPGTEPAIAACNAPWATIGNDGTVYAGGALYTSGGTLQKYPRQGRAGLSVSRDGGKSWSKMVYGINIANFAPGVTGIAGDMNPWSTPWDGANGVADPITGTFYSTATVNGVISVSEDKGQSFSKVYTTGGGTITAAFGTVATAHFVTDATTFPGAKCPCLAFGVSTDKARTWKQSLIAEDGQFSRTGASRYPAPVADPAHKGHFAVSVYAPDHKSVKVYYTDDTGQTWKSASPQPVPATIPVSEANMTSAGYTSDGRLLVTWRGFRGPGAFNTFAAMLTGDSFGPTIKVSPQLSEYPPLTYAGNYGIGGGGGDFTTWISGNATTAFVAFPYAPGGVAEDTYLARIPLTLLAH